MIKSIKKVIITGPTGAIGIALVQRLASEGIEVTAICHRNSKRIKHLFGTGKIQIIECNLDELENLYDTLDKDYDVFYHFGWACTVGESRNDVNAQLKNIEYTLAAVELANKLGCNKFIGAGSQAEFGRYEGMLNSNVPTFPENGYGVAKLCAGQLSRIRCEQLGMKHIWTRILSVYGPGDGLNTMVMNTIGKLLRGEKPLLTKGEQIWDYLYSKDAAKAMMLLGQSGKHGKIYCLGSGSASPLCEYVETIKKEVNCRAEIGYGEVPYAPKQVMYLCADISDLQEDTGFVADYAFDEGIKETVTWYQENIMENR